MNDEQRQGLPAPEASTEATAPKTEPTPTAPKTEQTASAPKKSGTGAKKDGSRERATTKETSKSGGDRVTSRTSGGSRSAPKAPSKAKKEKVELSSVPRSSRPAHRIIPFLLIALAIFLGCCLILNIFCNASNKCAANPSAHWMGSAGYYICYALFGAFGPAAFALPVLILNMAFFWKAYVDNRLLLEKTIASAVALIFLATFIHTCCIAAIAPERRALSAAELIRHGSYMTGGGLVGGGIGYLLVSGLNALGGILISVFLTLLSVFFFLGMTPQHLVERIKAARSLKKAGSNPLGVDDNEPIIEQIRQKNKRAAENAQSRELEASGKPPKGAVRRLDPDDGELDDGLAPMPMPVLDASDDSEESDNPLFVPEDVRREVFRNLTIAGEHGGLFVAPTHMLEPDVPVENLIAYIEACRDFTA